ncbi:hypothetical protein Ahy_B01g052736 [Arachis hypogaea]|uniref:SWIM-type domain-containing protein n=1 Tax=Arachis hypogaea TaxID=3818 RepID=A0A445AQB4_ARAHY|nr:hypothetical protein Ahy_B01g052736 [Arachis hypogaea]
MMRVTHCDRWASVFSVEEVEPMEGWCQTSYRSLHYPCRHVFTAYAAAIIEWGNFVDPVYKMASVFKIYEIDFLLIPDEKMWPTWYGA